MVGRNIKIIALAGGNSPLSRRWGISKLSQSQHRLPTSLSWQIAQRSLGFISPTQYVCNSCLDPSHRDLAYRSGVVPRPAHKPTGTHPFSTATASMSLAPQHPYSLLNPIAMYSELSRLALASYESNKREVDDFMTHVLKSNQLVLMMEGTVDSPKSLLSLNVVKMLCQVQALPLMSIDMLEHPAILGYGLSVSKLPRGPLLFKNGSFFGDHDRLLTLYQNSQLQIQIGTSNRETNPAFRGELPIALY